MQGDYQEQQQIVGHVSLVQKLKSALNLSSKMPPSKMKKNLVGLISLAPQIQDNLLEKVLTPLQIEEGCQAKPFLRTEFNRDGDSYRSPYTNNYYPASQDGFKPTGQLRRMEEVGTVLFEQYTKLYYGSDCVGNFYVAEGFADNSLSCGYFAKKKTQESQGYKGIWDSFNIVDIVTNGKRATYKLKSTVMVEMQILSEGAGAINMTGFLTKQVVLDKDLSGKNQELVFDEHLVTVGEMIEENQTKLRQHLQSIYLAKTKSIVFNCRLEQTVEMQDHRMKLAQGLKNLGFKPRQ